MERTAMEGRRKAETRSLLPEMRTASIEGHEILHHKDVDPRSLLEALRNPASERIRAARPVGFSNWASRVLERRGAAGEFAVSRIRFKTGNPGSSLGEYFSAASDIARGMRGGLQVPVASMRRGRTAEEAGFSLGGMRRVLTEEQYMRAAARLKASPALAGRQLEAFNERAAFAVRRRQEILEAFRRKT